MGELTHTWPMNAVDEGSHALGDSTPLMDDRPRAHALDPAATDDGILPRLALWLAEVSAEAALARLQPLERPTEAPTTESLIQ